MGEQDTTRDRGGAVGRGRRAARRVVSRLVRADLDALEHRLVLELQAAGRETVDRERVLAAAHGDLVGQHAALTREHEALRSRVEALEHTLGEIGGAMSREHGLTGAAGAYREHVYLLHELRRDLRQHRGQPHGAAAVDGGTADPAGAAPAAPATDPYAGKHPRRFDYAGFERRFRGDPETVKDVLSERYLPMLRDLPAVVAGGAVVDIGCGRGELLEALQAAGVRVVGVEPEPALAAQARERGVPVVEQLGADHLRSVPDGSLGAVTSFHVVEHLVVDDLIELLELAARKLRPGGLFVAETPNPMTFLTLHESYLLDPTHVQALHPALLSWLAEGAGFRGVELTYHSPAASLRIPPLQGDGPLVPQLDAAFARLNHQLYGPQDYSLVARA